MFTQGGNHLGASIGGRKDQPSCVTAQSRAFALALARHGDQYAVFAFILIYFYSIRFSSSVLQNQIKAMDSDTMRTPSSSARSSRTTTGSALRSTTTSSRGRLSGGGTILSQ